MLYLKKYFTEGLIQMAILLSLCGVRVDVGLEPYLPPSWHEMILGPSSTLTQTQFHNLRNIMEESHSMHPKNVDLDGFFTTRRLLGWVRSLDRLQVPHAELETWLVQREPDPLPAGCPNQLSPVERATSGIQQNRTELPMELRDRPEEEENNEGGTHQRGALDDRGEEEKEEDLSNIQRQRKTEERGRPGSSCGNYNNREHPKNEDETMVSLQECLKLLEETFPFREEHQLSNAACRRENQLSDRESLLSPIIPTDNPSLEMELNWQDLLDIMEPEGTTSFDYTLDSRTSRTFRDLGSERVLLGRFGSQSQLEPALLSLTPSAELDDHSSTLNTNVDSLQSPPDQIDMLAEDAQMGQNAEEDLTTFNMNLLTQDVDGIEPENHPVFGVNFHSYDTTFSSFSPSLEQNSMTGDLLDSSSVFLTDREEIDGEDSFPSPLDDLLEDAAILDEIRLLDIALEEGFSPEMAARLEEEGYLNRETAQQGTGEDNVHLSSNMPVTGDQDQQDRDDEEADSDSGLSLDFSHSPASPCASEASSYSSSSSSTSSSSCVSAVESLFSEDEDNGESLVDSDMEVEVTIKQEELDEQEMGAVGGGYPGEDKKFFPYNYGDHKPFHGFPWLEHIGHDHTYNQPWASNTSPTLGKIPTRHTKTSPRHDSSKPHHRSSTRHIPPTMWSRDERRAQALKIPFSNELIINLPVEEFNDLLTNYKLNEEQLALIRDIRRRGKNKIAAQNCRKRKLGVLLSLEDEVTSMRRRRSRLLREKQEALRNLQDMKHRFNMLYQEVFSKLRDEEGRPLDAAEYLLNFDDGSVRVESHQQRTDSKNSKKQRDKKK